MTFKQLYAVPDIISSNIDHGYLHQGSFTGTCFIIGRYVATLEDGVTITDTDKNRKDSLGISFVEISAEKKGPFRRACREMSKLTRKVNGEINKRVAEAHLGPVPHMARAAYITAGVQNA